MKILNVKRKRVIVKQELWLVNNQELYFHLINKNWDQFNHM